MIVLFTLCLGLMANLSGCDRRSSRNESSSSAVQLAAPANVSISVSGRLMTVTWDAVDHASGYVITTTSIGCASGNRIVNTAAQTATNHAGAEADSDTAESGITNRGNGFVTFTGATSFTIWLMPQTNSRTEVMATSLTASVMAIGDGDAYSDSGDSAVVTLNKIDYR